MKPCQYFTAVFFCVCVLVFVWCGGGEKKKKNKKKHALIFLKTMQYAVFPEFICGQSVRGHTCKDLLVRQCLDDGDIIAIIHGKFFNFFLATAQDFVLL